MPATAKNLGWRSQLSRRRVPHYPVSNFPPKRRRSWNELAPLVAEQVVQRSAVQRRHLLRHELVEPHEDEREQQVHDHHCSHAAVSTRNPRR